MNKKNPNRSVCSERFGFFVVVHLTKETDSLFGTRTYVYGNNGKLSSVSKSGTTYALSYDEYDRLKTYGSTTFTYDGYGNVKSKGSTTYGYTRGNFLASVGSNTYLYNAEGVRYKKVVNGATTDYYLDGNKILGEDRTDGKKLRYFYDIDGLCGIRYNGKNYVVVRNAYGDVVMLLKDRNVVAQYYYDAWGNCEVVQYSDNDDIGNINPFRWKGHYFDVESGLYYANGSYYDPEVGIHIDATSISSVVENVFEVFGLDRNGIMCYNILAYLPNVYSIFTTQELSANPDYDPDENKPWWELAWNAIFNWFISVLQWFNDLDVGWKIGIGLTLFALACIITALSAGQATAALAAIGQMTITFLVGIATGVAMSAVIALIRGESLPDALLNGLADAIFWGGVFAFISASVNFIKVKVRTRSAAKVSRNAAIDRAKELQKLPASKRPTMTSAAVDVNTGNIYYGNSGSISNNINSTLIDSMPKSSLTNWKVANCAEFNAVNNALNAGANMSNLVVTTVRVKTLTLASMCFNCQASLQGVLLVVSG